MITDRPWFVLLLVAAAISGLARSSRVGPSPQLEDVGQDGGDGPVQVGRDVVADLAGPEQVTGQGRLLDDGHAEQNRFLRFYRFSTRPVLRGGNARCW